MNSNKQSPKQTFFCNEVGNFRTDAPTGRYLAISGVKCECCGDIITTHHPIVVINGDVERDSVEKATSDLVELHPHHCSLEDVIWNRDGSFTLKFGS